jgi:hypothetical protein
LDSLKVSHSFFVAFHVYDSSEQKLLRSKGTGRVGLQLIGNNQNEIGAVKKNGQK